MGGLSDEPPLETRLAALLARQHGVAARRQLRALGLRDDAIDARVRKGRLIRVGRALFAAGHGRLTVEGRWMAAVLECGDGAVLSHRSAAALWGLWQRRPPLVEVTVPRHRRGRGRGRITVHRCPSLTGTDITRKASIPVTRPARTLLDLAECVERRPLERALDEAERLRLCTEAQLRSAVVRHPGRVGAARLAAVLEEHELGSTATANEFEKQLLALCDRSGIERPEVNTDVGPYIVDFLWRSQRLIVETDGYATHATRRVFETDHARDVELGNAGWRVRRFTWRQLTHEPGWVARKLHEAVHGTETAVTRSRAPRSRSNRPLP